MNVRLPLCALGMLIPVSAIAATLNIFAAASLSDALEQIAKTYHAASGDTLRFNFASSSTLALQIEQGAPADVFFSADEKRMDALARAGLIIPATRRSLLSNTLVIVVNADRGAFVAAPVDLASSGIRHVALAEPQTVPAGIYAKEYLQNAGVWEKIAGKIVPTENVRACLAAVESGNAEAGIVYRTDALISKKVRIVCEIGVAQGPKISYPVAVVEESRNREAARKFTRYLASPAALSAFFEYGFLRAD